jgi:hypothetical protein
MGLIDEAGATRVTITATVDGGAGDWAPGGEVYPVVLGWGAELTAPGVYFVDANAHNTSIFEVAFYSSKDTAGYASIVGSSASPIGIGMNATNTAQTSDRTAIDVLGTLYLANASVNGSANNGADGIHVTGTGTLILGEDQSGGVMGTVHIGNALRTMATDGINGIVSAGIIQDVMLPGGLSSVVIEGQGFADLVSTAGTIALASNPVFGSAPLGKGFGSCGIRHDWNGLAVLDGTIAVANATFECINLNAVGVEGGAVTVSNSLIRNCQYGLATIGGSITADNCTIMYSVAGVAQEGGTVDLSGGGNTVICSSSREDTIMQGLFPVGMDVYNAGTGSLNASNVAWDTAGPDYFTCSADFTTCTCNNASCSTNPGSDDMDAVTLDAGIITTGNTQSPLALDAGCK